MSQYTEIERRFLVDPTKLPIFHPYRYVTIQQGYLSNSPPVVRVRIETDARTKGKNSYITTKGKGEITRKEVNIRIGIPDAEALMEMARYFLAKQRWYVNEGVMDGKVWHVDKFLETDPYAVANGLWLAEIELQDESEPFYRPDWLLEEVTSDPTYSNVNLALPSSESPHWREKFLRRASAPT
jgi:adenylate cyclase